MANAFESLSALVLVAPPSGMSPDFAEGLNKKSGLLSLATTHHGQGNISLHRRLPVAIGFDGSD
jgi:hypothetical protein